VQEVPRFDERYQMCLLDVLGNASAEFELGRYSAPKPAVVGLDHLEIMLQNLHQGVNPRLPEHQ